MGRSGLWLMLEMVSGQWNLHFGAISFICRHFVMAVVRVMTTSVVLTRVDRHHARWRRVPRRKRMMASAQLSPSAAAVEFLLVQHLFSLHHSLTYPGHFLGQS